MKIYINNEVEACENNGVLKEHFKGFVKTAQEENVVIILRPVNPITKQLLLQKYPTKPSTIKAKSSDWGIQSGFIIALDELTFLNKIGLKKNETQLEKINLLCKRFSIKLDKNNQENNKINPVSLKLKDNETILKISNEHFWFLLTNTEKYGIIDFEFSLEDNIFVKCSQPKNEKNEIILYLEKEKNNDIYTVYYVFTLDDENKVKNLNNRDLKQTIEIEKKNLIYFPISIFCKEISQEKKPIIPDYDLFAVCWTIDDSIKYHQPRISTNSFAGLKVDSWETGYYKEGDFNKIFKKPHSRAKNKDFNQDEEGAGNALDETKEFLDKLNKNLGYKRGLKDELCPIHHTFELVNPYSKDFNENFYTFFLPNKKLLIDFTFPSKIKVDKKDISYFAVDKSSYDGINLWKKFLEPFLIYVKTKGYYVPNNCFVKQTDFLGFANSSNPWVRKIREEKKEIQTKLNETQIKLEKANKENKVKNEIKDIEKIEQFAKKLVDIELEKTKNSLKNDKHNYKKIKICLQLA